MLQNEWEAQSNLRIVVFIEFKARGCKYCRFCFAFCSCSNRVKAEMFWLIEMYNIEFYLLFIFHVFTWSPVIHSWSYYRKYYKEL